MSNRNADRIPSESPPGQETDASGPSSESVEEGADAELRTTFQLIADEGTIRLKRDTGDLITTGVLGGMDVSLGVLALLLVLDATGSSMLAALAFAIGFIALLLGRSELYTENFLIPLATIAGGKGTVGQLIRLWTVTLITNMVGALILAGLVVAAFPHLWDTAIEVAAPYAGAELTEAIALGLLAGITITFMTWIVHAAHSEFGRMVAVTMSAFLLSAGHMHHVVVISGEMFIALLTGAAPFHLGDWARVAALATVTNAVGGLLLVTVFRFAQVGPRVIEDERHRRPS